MMAEDLKQLAGFAARRGLTTPLRLFLTGHRPLAFFAGQMLYMAAPLALLAGWEDVNRWAAWLSAPQTSPAPKLDQMPDQD